MAAFPSADLVRRALSGHAAVGLLAGGLIYLLALSGTMIVVHEEWQRWEQPNIAEMEAIDPAAVQRAARQVLASENGKPLTEHFYVHLPTDALPRTVITTDNQAVYIDADGNVAGPEAHAWTEFLIGLHYYLHLPSTLGLTVVGALGVMLAALVVGGVLAHPRIFRDAFRLRARGQRQLAFADWHNRLGVWTLPFSLASAITGALIGLATVLAFAMASIYYNGDMEAVFAPVFGAEPAHDERAAPLANIEAALRHMAAAHPEVRPTYVILHEPATAGQYLQILADHPRRLIFGEYYTFDSDGRFQGTTGLADGTLGQQLAASVYKLHFGSFGGLPVKLAYMVFGLALMVMTGTGVWIWLIKRRQRGRASPRLEAAWAATLWGAPALLVLAYDYRALTGPEAQMTALFWGGLAMMIGCSAAIGNAAASARWLRAALGGLLCLTALWHLATLDAPMPAMITMDALLVLTGIGMIAYGRLPRGGSKPVGISPLLDQSAE